MTLYGALHPISDVDRVYVERQKRGRGLIGREIYVKAEENNLAWYVRNSNERLTAGVRKIKIFYIVRGQTKRINLKGTGRMPA